MIEGIKISFESRDIYYYILLLYIHYYLNKCPSEWIDEHLLIRAGCLLQKWFLSELI